MQAFCSFIEWINSQHRVLLFGASEAGNCAATWLKSQGLEVVAFLDNDPNKWGTFRCGREVRRPDKGLVQDDFPILISSCYARDISLQLRQLGIFNYRDFSFATDVDRWQRHYDPEPIKAAQSEIELLRAHLQDQASLQTLEGLLAYRRTGDAAELKPAAYPVYSHPQVSAQPGDVVVDGGAWHGDTAEEFLVAMHEDGTIYAFEPDPDNLRVLAGRCSTPKVKPVGAGLWRHSGRMGFVPAASSMESKLTTDGEISVEVMSLDEFTFERGHRADLVKMDIEGAEGPALEGAANLLRECAPRLQISIYHRFDDLWTLPETILRHNPNYRFHLGHHSLTLVDTVLYGRTTDS